MLIPQQFTVGSLRLVDFIGNLAWVLDDWSVALDELMLESVDVSRRRRRLVHAVCRLLVWSGLKDDDATDSKVVSRSVSGVKMLDVNSSKLLKIKLSTLILSHLQQCQMTLQRPKYDIFLDDRSSQDL